MRLVLSLFEVLLGKIVRLLADFIRYIRFYYFDLDQITECSTFEETQDESTKPPSKLHYLIPLITSLLIHLDTFSILYAAKFNTNSTAVNNILTRKIFIKILWPQVDVIVNFGILMITLTDLLLVIASPPSKKYKIFAFYNEKDKYRTIVINNTVWNQTNSSIILKYRKFARKYYGLTMFSGWLVAMLNCTIAIFFNWTGSFRDFLFTLYLPLFILHLAHACIHVPFCFLMCIYYARIQQTLLIEKISQLTVRKQWKAFQNSTKMWSNWTAVNREVLDFFDRLQVYNQFWSRLATVYFFITTFFIVYMIYGLLAGYSRLDILQKLYFIFYLVQLSCSMIIITHNCSSIVRNNVRLYRSNVAFFYVYQRTFTIKLGQLIQMDKMIANYRGARNGFILANGLIIDSRMFEIMIYYISRLLFKTIA